MESPADLERAIETVVVREIAGCLALLSAERLSGGANQAMYCLRIATPEGECKLCLRRALGTAAKDAGKGPGLTAEAALLRAARSRRVPVPEVRYVLQPADGLDEGFIMDWLNGETLGSRIVKAPEFESIRGALAYECGTILGRIHSIDVTAPEFTALPLQRITPEQFVRQTWDRYATLRTPQPMIDYTARWLLDHLPENPRMALVHNDFRNGNLMVTPQGICAVLDWELAHIGDPMRDLGWLCTRSWRFGRADKPVGGFGEYRDLFAGYQDTTGIVVNRDEVHFWEVFGSFWWAVGCLEMANAGRSGPEKNVERPAIGRRSSECQIDCVDMLIPGPVDLVESVEPPTPDDIARIDEIIAEVKDFLRGEVASFATGRQRFLAKVAANSLDIVLRELRHGSAAAQAEHQRLRSLLQSDKSLNALRWELCEGLRQRTLSLSLSGLTDHLRLTVANQVAIDQPGYAGLRALSALTLKGNCNEIAP